MTDIKTVTYQTESDVFEHRFLTFLVQMIDERGKDKKRTGNKVPVQLPVYFRAASADAAEAAALAFWRSETEKAAEKIERGKRLAQSKRAA